jgi:hypothetical protein
MRIRNVFTIVLFAALAFGGTFTCRSGDDHHDHDDDHHDVHAPDAPPHQALDETGD